MIKLTSTKVYDGFSTCFRQWRAEGTHCRFIHGYGTSFKVTFEGELDHRNWVFDFGGMKRAKHTIDGMPPKQYFDWLLDHTMVVASDDPYLETFKQMDADGIVQLRVLPNVGCERFAEFLLDKINGFLDLETEGRVKAVELEFREHARNTAVARLER